MSHFYYKPAGGYQYIMIHYTKIYKKLSETLRLNLICPKENDVQSQVQELFRKINKKQISKALKLAEYFKRGINSK